MLEFQKFMVSNHTKKSDSTSLIFTMDNIGTSRAVNTRLPQLWFFNQEIEGDDNTGELDFQIVMEDLTAGGKYTINIKQKIAIVPATTAFKTYTKVNLDMPAGLVLSNKHLVSISSKNFKRLHTNPHIAVLGKQDTLCYSFVSNISEVHQWGEFMFGHGNGLRLTHACTLPTDTPKFAKNTNSLFSGWHHSLLTIANDWLDTVIDGKANHELLGGDMAYAFGFVSEGDIAYDLPDRTFSWDINKFTNMKSWKYVNGLFSYSDISNPTSPQIFYGMTPVDTMQRMFGDCPKFNNISNTANIFNNTIKDASYFMTGAQSVNASYVTHINYSNIQYTTRMFAGCKFISNSKLPSGYFNMNEVLNTSGMFASTNINVEKDTTISMMKVVNMDYMFSECSDLRNTPKFSNFSALESLVGLFKNTAISDFTYITNNDGVATVKYIRSMCEGCTNLKHPMKFSHVDAMVDMSFAYKDCINLDTTVGLPNSDFREYHTTTKLKTVEGMFEGCAKMNMYININSDSLENFDRMFYGCDNFDKPVNFTKFDNIKKPGRFFDDNKSVPSIDVEDFNPMYWETLIINLATKSDPAKIKPGLILDKVVSTPMLKSTYDALPANMKILVNEIELQEPMVFTYSLASTDLQVITASSSADGSANIGEYVNFAITMDQKTTLTEFKNLDKIPLVGQSAYVYGKLREYNHTRDNSAGFDGVFIGTTGVKSISIGDVIRNKFTFANYKEVTKIDLSGYTERLHNKNAIGSNRGQYFQDCHSLTELIGFDTYTNIIRPSTLAETFRNCKVFNQDLSTVDYSFVKDLTSYLNGCEKWNQPVNDWNLTVDRLTLTPQLFANCLEFNQPVNWRDYTRRVESSSGMFLNCNKLNSEIDLNYYFNKNIGNMFKNCAELSITPNMFATQYLENTYGTFENCRSMGGTVYINSMSKVTTSARMFANSPNIKFELWKHKLPEVTNVESMFEGAKNIILNGNGAREAMDLQTSKCTNFKNMFKNAITSAYTKDAVKIDTSAGIDFEGMFYGCTGFKNDNSSIDFNLLNGTNFKHMFNGCSNIKALKHPFAPVNIYNADSMFYNCNQLNLTSTFDTTNAESLSYTFYNCVRQQRNIIGTFENAERMINTFSGCTRLNQSFDLTSINKCTNISGFLNNCTSMIGSVAIKSTTKLTNVNSMFKGCKLLEDITFSGDWSKVTSWYSLLDGCESFNKPINSLSFESGVEFAYMFRDCKIFNQPVLINNTVAINLYAFNGIFWGCNDFDNFFEFNYIITYTTTSSYSLFNNEKQHGDTEFEDINPLYWDNFLTKSINLPNTTAPANSTTKWSDKIKVTPVGEKVLTKFKADTGINLLQEYVVQVPAMITLSTAGFEVIKKAVGIGGLNQPDIYFWDKSPYNRFAYSLDSNITQSAHVTRDNPVINNIKADTTKNLYIWGKLYNFNIDYAVITDMQYGYERYTSLTWGNVIRKGSKVQLISTGKSDVIDFQHAAKTKFNHNISNGTNYRGIRANKVLNVDGLFHIDELGWSSEQFSGGEFTEITGLNYLQNVGNAEKMFKDCVNLVTIPELKVPNLVYAKGMFENCKSLTKAVLKDTTQLFDSELMFKYCENITSITISNVESITKAWYMFSGCSNLTEFLSSNYNFLSLTDGSHMFSGCSKFNQPIDFKMPVTSTLSSFLSSCVEFNQPIKIETGTALTNLNSLISSGWKFNNTIEITNVSNVTNAQNMLGRCKVFNQPIDDLLARLVSVTNLSSFLDGAEEFNQPIIIQNSSKLVNVNLMMQGCLVFNSEFKITHTKQITNYSYLFNRCLVFNQLIDFDFSSATTISNMLARCGKYNQKVIFKNLGLACTNMNGVFNSSSSFNQPVDFGTQTINVVNLAEVFKWCDNFNQPVTIYANSATKINGMFQQAISMDSPIVIKNLPAGVDASYFLSSATNFNSTLDIDFTKINKAHFMFSYASKLTYLPELRLINATTMLSMLENTESLDCDLLIHSDNCTNIAYILQGRINAKQPAKNVKFTSLAKITRAKHALQHTSLNQESYDDFLIKLSEAKTESTDGLENNGLVYSPSVSAYRDQCIANGFKITGDTMGGNPNLINRNFEVQDTIVNINGNIQTYTDTNGVYATAPLIEATEPTYTLSKTTPTGVEAYFRWRWLDANKNYLARVANASNTIVANRPANAKWLQVSYPRNNQPKVEVGSIKTVYNSEWLINQNIIDPSRTFGFYSNSSIEYPIDIVHTTFNGVQCTRVNSQANTPNKVISLFSNIRWSSIESSRLMTQDIKDSHLVVSMDLTFEGNTGDNIKYYGYYQYVDADGETVQRRTEEKWFANNLMAGWQRVTFTLPKIEVDPRDHQQSFVIRIIVIIVNAAGEILRDVPPTHYLYAKNFKIEKSTNPNALPTPFIVSDIVEPVNLLKKANNFVYNYTNYQSNIIRLSKNNVKVTEWGAEDAVNLEFVGVNINESLYGYASESGLLFSQPYTYMVYFKNPTDKWINFNINGLLAVDPNTGPGASVNKWVAPGFSGLIVLKGWTRSNYDFIQYRYIRVAEAENGPFLAKYSFIATMWREKLYAGHADSIWTKGTED